MYQKQTHPRVFDVEKFVANEKTCAFLVFYLHISKKRTTFAAKLKIFKDKIEYFPK